MYMYKWLLHVSAYPRCARELQAPLGTYSGHYGTYFRYVYCFIRERGSVLYLGMAQKFWDFANLAIA